MQAQRDGIELKQHEVWDEFIQVKSKRDALVEAIHDDYAGHASYLKHYDITSEEVAADYLVSQGLSRESARADATSHTELFLRLDHGTLSADVAKSLPNISLSSAMAQQQLVDDYMASYAQDNKASRMVLAFTRKDVAALNEAIRQRLMASGHIAPTQNTIRITIQDNEGEYQQPVAFAAGDRVMFRENNKELGVMNGTLGSIKNIDGSSFHVTLDNGKDISFDAKEYTKFQHGYATTVHKAQGVTVDETYVLASQHFDRHATYVAMTRHRRNVKLYAASNHFRTIAHMKQSLSRSGANRSTLDYTTQALNYMQEQQQRMQSLWERFTIAYKLLRERAETHGKQLQEKVQSHMNKKQEQSSEAQAERLIKKVHAAADAHPETQDMPEYHRYIMASSFALDKAENEVLPLKERIVNVRASMQLLREGIDQSPDDLSEAREDMEDIRQRMRGLTFQHVPEPLRNTALRYTSSIELLDEIIQELAAHRHNARANSSIRRVERDRDNDRDFDE